MPCHYYSTPTAMKPAAVQGLSPGCQVFEGDGANALPCSHPNSHRATTQREYQFSVRRTTLPTVQCAGLKNISNQDWGRRLSVTMEAVRCLTDAWSRQR